jgi:Mlc titration factor MtfA (ptsG expression regulator)
MLFSWLKKRRRRRLLEPPFPHAWLQPLGAIAHYRLLTDSDKQRLHDLVRIFIAEKEFEGCKGLEITDEVRVTIAALACLMVLEFKDYCFDNVQTILVYPEAYTAPEQKVVGGVVLEDASDRLGEAHYRGPLILSWADVIWDAGETRQGTNLVFHEFAHQIDMLNGAADGVPLLPRRLRGPWQKIMASEYERLRRAAERGRETLIDPYGTTDPAEFFAVVTECFFDLPGPLQAEHPDLYALFRDYYQQDPVSRVI